MPRSRILGDAGKFVIGCALALAVFVPLDSASARGFNVLYSFTGGNDSGNPFAGLIRVKANLYGTTYFRGLSGCGGSGCGTVFKLTPDGTQTVLYSFTGGNDGGNPYAGLIKDAADNLYGTTFRGGASDYGTVFKLAPDGTETVLYSFTGGNDGSYPAGGLIKDAAGNFYGTTTAGGTNNSGTVFKLASDGTETVLYSFTGGNDGGSPYASLIHIKGNFYGTTLGGGVDGAGTVFEVAPDGTETVLYSFTGGNDGGYPADSLIKDAADNLYGTTMLGGTNSKGTVFELAPDGTETVLHSFTGGRDGGSPNAGLLADAAGNFYSTADTGGNAGCGGIGCGTVFKIAPDSTFTVLHVFTGGSDGKGPLGGLIANNKGHLFGTTELGGANGYGTVFELKE